MLPPQERILARICKQIADVYLSQVVEQVTGVPKTPSWDRILQCTVEQILDVLVSEMVKQLMEVPKTLVAWLREMGFGLEFLDIIVKSDNEPALTSLIESWLRE